MQMPKVCLQLLFAGDLHTNAPFTVFPIHLAFVLINDGASEAAPGKPLQHSLFSSVIEKAGGDPVCMRLTSQGNVSDIWFTAKC